MTDTDFMLRKVVDGTRSFAVEEWEIRSDSDGRTVEGRVIPYNEVVTIRDMDATGQIIEFREQFLKGSCLAMAQACEKRRNASFIAYLLDHNETSLSHRIGYAQWIRDAKDGGYAGFRLYPGPDLEKIQAMLRESHTGLSVKFADTRPPKLVDGIVSRVQVHIDHVAATADPAYTGAQVLAMRNDEAVAVEYGTPKLDEVTAWLEAMKVAPV